MSETPGVQIEMMVKGLQEMADAFARACTGFIPFAEAIQALWKGRERRHHPRMGRRSRPRNFRARSQR